MQTSVLDENGRSLQPCGEADLLQYRIFSSSGCTDHRTAVAALSSQAKAKRTCCKCANNRSSHTASACPDSCNVQGRHSCQAVAELQQPGIAQAGQAACAACTRHKMAGPQTEGPCNESLTSELGKCKNRASDGSTDFQSSVRPGKGC